MPSLQCHRVYVMLQKLLLVTFGTLLGLGIAAGLWWALLRSPDCDPVPEAVFATNAIKMFKEPCIAFEWIPRDREYPPHTVRYNAFGMHDDPVSLVKPDNVYRILILGDSYTQGLQLPVEQGFVDLLEAALNKDNAAQRYEVVNFGIDTLGTDRLLLLYALVGYQLDADLVLLATYVGNDVQNNSIELAALRNEGYQPRPFLKLDAGGNLRLHNWIEPLPDSDAPAPGWLRRAFTERSYPIVTPEAPAVTSTDPYRLEYPVQLGLYLPEDALWAEAWALSEAILIQFQQLVTAQGSQFGLIVIPDRRAVHPADYAATVEQYPFVGDFNPDDQVGRMVSLAEQHDIPVLNLLPALEAVDADDQRAYLSVDGHYNEIGHAVTATELLDWLIETGLVEAE